MPLQVMSRRQSVMSKKNYGSSGHKTRKNCIVASRFARQNKIDLSFNRNHKTRDTRPQ